MKSLDSNFFCFFPRKGMEVSIPGKNYSVFFFLSKNKIILFPFFFISGAVSGRIRTIAAIYTVFLSPKPQELLVSSFPIRNCFFFLTRLSFEIA